MWKTNVVFLEGWILIISAACMTKVWEYVDAVWEYAEPGKVTFNQLWK